MSRLREFEIKRGNILYRRKIEFKSSLQEFIWKLKMKIKGYTIKEMK
ncbi:hypothetical protein [Sporosalibacterium faouarense]|nr:hypothetical protein [Sporosalibacterium faouarense]